VGSRGTAILGKSGDWEVGGQPFFVTSRHCEAMGQRFTAQRLGATQQPAANPLVDSRGMSRTVSGRIARAAGKTSCLAARAALNRARSLGPRGKPVSKNSS
jgi:hypothetical protein